MHSQYLSSICQSLEWLVSRTHLCLEHMKLILCLFQNDLEE